MPKKKITPIASQRERVYLPCKLTEDEMKQRGKDLATAHTSLKVLEQRKKEFNDQNKSQVAGVEARIEILSQEINTGIEHRDVPCFWRFDDPVEGQKSLIREDTFELIRIEEMNTDDMQSEMDLD
jgi:hypothetical protein